MTDSLIIILVSIGAFVVVGGITVAVVLTGIKNYRKSQELASEGIVQKAIEQAKTIEIEARDKALKVLQDSENETNRRRLDISREDERLQKRRMDMDHRIERLEQREQNLNKRQSSLDKRANDIEKMYSDQMEELQRIGQMSMDEAKQVLLTEAEKEARNDMARIIRQIEA
jgi:ribonuclease Y